MRHNRLVDIIYWLLMRSRSDLHIIYQFCWPLLVYRSRTRKCCETLRSRAHEVVRHVLFAIHMMIVLTCSHIVFIVSYYPYRISSVLVISPISTTLHNTLQSWLGKTQNNNVQYRTYCRVPSVRYLVWYARDACTSYFLSTSHKRIQLVQVV